MKTLALLLSCLAFQDPPRDIESPLPPGRAAAEFRLPAGLRMELAAAEPEISSPVAAAFDENGRLYVVEMLDYPTAENGKPPRGRIKRLEDADGDGRYEKAGVFAEEILMANGVMPWKGGVIVTAAPNVLYLKDTDGDGKADVRETLFEGFAVQNPQLRVSYPTLGIDNWIYVANGQRGGKIRPAGRQGAPPVDINGMDFRFDLVRPRHEAVTGFGQFGLCFDDWGHRFVCTNRNHVIPIVMPNRYFGRNPFLAAPGPTGDNQGAGGAARVFPISRFKTLAASHAGTFTASCGVWVYRGALLEALRGSVFTCEPTGNLVHQELLTQSGATFTWKPPREGAEFLASTDTWFRPVSLTEGPDGALYVVDMYRKEVEHPEWVPADLKYRYDWNATKDMGRLWRIVPEKHAAKPPRLSLGTAGTAELVELLESPNGWTRMTAHRLLLERQDRDAAGPLREKASSPNPLARLHAAWLLEGHDSLDLDLVLRLLGDPHPRIRESAVQLAARWIAASKPVQQMLARLADDPDPQVRFQAALALGDWDDDAILEPLARIARSGAQDRWTRLAVGSAVPGRAGALLGRVEDPQVVRELAALVGARRDPSEVSAVLLSLAPADSRRQTAALNGLAEGMGRRGAQLGAFVGGLTEPKARDVALDLLSRAAALAKDAARPLPERQDAIRLLVHVPWDAAAPALTALLAEDQPQEIRVAAVAALSGHKRPEVADLLLKGWKTYLPALRREVLEAMSRQPERLERLLSEVEAGRLAGGELGPNLIRQLTTHANAALRDRAKKALQANLPEERQKVLDQYKAAVGAKGDLARGRDVFQKNCGACHRIAGIGTHVGPDVSDTLSKAKEALLTDILDPSRVIDNNYANYIIRTKSGAVVSGFIAAQTASSLTLRRGEGQEDVVLRQDIEEMKSSGVSLMPEGMEKNITVEGMADLLTFLKGWRDLR